MRAAVSLLPESCRDALEAKMTELCGHINVAEARFLALLAEYDRGQGYAWHGLSGTAQWLNWQCGIGAVAARERVRTARALEGLPVIAAAFARGELSYSKVRALTRIATAENETMLLEIALNGTAQHVERLVSRYARLRRWEDNARAEAQHRRRGLSYFCDEDGSVILHARLPAEIGALVKKSIEAAMDVVEREAAASADPAAAETQSNVSAETSQHAADAAGNVEPSGERTDDPVSARRADALVHALRHFVACDDQACAQAAERYQLVVHIDQSLLARPDRECAHAFGHAHRCELEDGPRLAADTARRLGCGGALVGLVENADGEALDVGRKTRAIPRAIRRALQVRDGGCRFPGCTHTRFTEGHHVKHWADGGETKLANLITLCTYHHRLVHEGGFGLTATDDGLFVFTRPDGQRIAEAERLDRHLGQGSLFDLHRASGIEIDAGTARCRWQGETMDYGWATTCLYAADYPPVA